MSPNERFQSYDNIVTLGKYVSELQQSDNQRPPNYSLTIAAHNPFRCLHWHLIGNGVLVLVINFKQFPIGEHLASWNNARTGCSTYA